MRTAFLCLMLVPASLNLFCSKPAGDYPVDAALGFSTGPQIGDKIPDFSLPDQYGKMRNIKELVGKNGALLNFYRSASW